MIRALNLAAAVAFAVGLAGAAHAQTIDKNGRCHDAHGKFAKMEVCKGAATAAPAHCRDKTTKKFAKCSAPNSEAVPAAAAKTEAAPKTDAKAQPKADAKAKPKAETKKTKK